MPVVDPDAPGLDPGPRQIPRPRTGSVPTVAPDADRWAPAVPGAAAPDALAGAAEALRAGGVAKAGRIASPAAPGAAAGTPARVGWAARLPSRRRARRAAATGTDGGTDNGGPGPPGRFDRRRLLLAGATATGLAGVALYTTDKVLGGKPASSSRPAAERARDGGAFADRDESFARTAAPAAPSEPLPTNVYATASEAAAATEVTVPTILATDDPVLHLLRRATFGPTPGRSTRSHADGHRRAGSTAQLDPSSIADAGRDEVLGAVPRWRR